MFPAANTKIPTVTKEVAYVMCAPVACVYQHTVDDKDVNKPEYILKIKTTKRSDGVNIPIDLKVKSGEDASAYTLDSTMGLQFTILLNFKKGDVVSIASNVSIGGKTDWFTQGTGTGNLKEENLVVPVN